MVSLQCTPELPAVVSSFQAAFSRRSWPCFVAVRLPWVVQQGQRAVGGLASGASLRRHETRFYRISSQFRFRVDTLFELLFRAIVAVFKPLEIRIVVDDTLCSRQGDHSFGTASFFDHVSRPRLGLIRGHNRLVLAVIVTLRGVPVALPFWVSMYRSHSSCFPGDFQAGIEMTATAFRAVRTVTSRRITVVADGTYNKESLLTLPKEMQVRLVRRLRTDARLRRNRPKLRRGIRGRPPKYGPALPPFTTIARSTRGWQTQVVYMYG